MLLQGIKVGFALTGSFCTMKDAFAQMQKFIDEGAEVTPIISDIVGKADTRFISSREIMYMIKTISGKEPISSIVEAEPIGPNRLFDIMVVAPCTGNTLAKLANAITDTPVTMACKAHVRNGRPVVISLATNDGLSGNLKNIGYLFNSKNYYFVPFGQDNYKGKPNSLVAKIDMLIPTVLEALKGRQIQPVIICYDKDNG